MQKQKRKQEDGTPKTITIEVGPLTCHGTKSEIKRAESAMKGDLDAMVRQYLAVGKRSKVVTTTLTSA